MIYAITPNPALDLGGIADRIIPNKKTYVYNETRYPGGNAINAARMASGLGAPVIATGFLGGTIGEEIKSLLDQEAVPHDFVPISGRTRISITVSNRSTHAQTRFSFSGPQILPSEFDGLMSRISQIHPPALLVVGGSLPPGVSVSHLEEILKLAKERGFPVILDAPSRTLKKVLRCGVALIKPNLLEFQELILKRTSSPKSVIQEARKLLKHVPLICVSSINGGALLISKHSTWFGVGPKVKVRSTVGAGDSMVGAIAAKVSQEGLLKGCQIDTNTGDSQKDLLRAALAAAVATTTTRGTVLGSPKLIQSFLPKIKLQQID